MWHLNRWGGRALPLDVDAFGWAVVGLLLVVLLVDRHLSFRSNEQYPRYMPVRQGQSQLVGQSINQTNHSMGASQITVKLRLSVRTSVRLSVTQYLLRWFPCSHEFHDQVTQTDPQNIFTVPSSNRCTHLLLSEIRDGGGCMSVWVYVFEWVWVWVWVCACVSVCLPTANCIGWWVNYLVRMLVI